MIEESTLRVQTAGEFEENRVSLQFFYFKNVQGAFKNPLPFSRM